MLSIAKKIINKNYHRKQEYLHLITSETGDYCISMGLLPGVMPGS